MNPEAPQILGTIKLNKENKSIRPIVNWKNSPGYKLATHVAKLLKDNIRLPNIFNVPNSRELIHSLKGIKTQTNTKVCSFDIKNMYTNIPQNELMQIIKNTLEHNNTPENQKQELIILVEAILNQNYMQHMNQQYKQNEGLAMGAPTSAILAEIFMQHHEHNYIINILQKHNIIDYYRYVDEILIIYNEDYTDIDNTLKEFNSIHPNIQYTIEKQNNKILNYLDISIENIHNNFVFGIYRKPTTTDLIIHNNSCHPTEHKNSAIRFLLNIMNTYPISANNKHRELQHIQTILLNKNYPQHTHKKNRRKQNKNTTTNTTQKKKWATLHMQAKKLEQLLKSLKT
jgi:hypothetical protein